MKNKQDFRLCNIPAVQQNYSWRQISLLSQAILTGMWQRRKTDTISVVHHYCVCVCVRVSVSVCVVMYVRVHV